jgi:hypothetical protein
MKNLVFVCIAMLLLISSSCFHSSKRVDTRHTGIDKVVVIDSKYSIICFNSKCSSGELSMAMAKSGNSVVKTSELKSILSDLDKKGKKHASLYKANEFSAESTNLLKKISSVMATVKQPEELAPIFHEKSGQLIADWGDFMAGWSTKGYIVVIKKTTR